MRPASIAADTAVKGISTNLIVLASPPCWSTQPDIATFPIDPSDAIPTVWPSTSLPDLIGELVAIRKPP